MLRGCAVLAVILAAAPDARAGAIDLTDVASSFDENNKFDFRFRVRYDHTEKRARIKRESEQMGATAIQIFKDLAYEQQRDQISLRAEVGLYHDLQIHFELPIIIGQQQVYGYDQQLGAGCTWPDMAPQSATPTCVDQSNSTTTGGPNPIVPLTGYGATARGVGTQYPTVFRGALRGARGGSGGDAFDTFNIGLTWAPLSQARDDTKPTWVVLVEGQFSIGTIMKLDRTNPDANHGVSDGTHRLFIRTALSKRFKYLEPYWGLWYLLPIPRSDSLYRDYGPAQKTKNPQMQGGTAFGTAIIPYDRPAKQYQIALDLRGRIEGHFNGRGYSEAWELLASSPALACDSTMTLWNPACDPAAANNGYNNSPEKGAFTGVTTIENYATLGADVMLRAQVGPYVQFRTGFEYTRDQGHYITGEDIGKPMNATGRVMNANEFNPAYRPIIDLPGRRYRVEEVNVFNFFIAGQVMF
jgi:hypothetical protein